MNGHITAWTEAGGADRARRLFEEAYGAVPGQIWCSPGRVNLVGEHTDYNDGLALPIALPHATYVAASRRNDDRVRLTSGLDSVMTWEGTLESIRPGAVDGWVAYAAGVLWAMTQDGIHLPGLDIAITSCVPLGAGLSSSAAIECAVGLAAASLSGVPLDGDDLSRARLARLAIRAENEVAGAPTGGMDQAASLRAHEGHALLLDCRDDSVRHEPVDLEAAGLALLVIDTRASHSLGDGQYGRRRATCEAASRTLGIETLREVTDLDDALSRLDGEAIPRVRHVVTEIARVRQFVDAATAQDWERVGAVMNASHDSLRDDYEVSCVELDTAVAAARDAGALGARMTGGGFGGSAIALVRETDLDAVGSAVLAAAERDGLVTPELHLAVPAAPGRKLS